MKGMCYVIVLILLLPVVIACGLPHQHRGLSFITDPYLELFGGRLETKDNLYLVNSYFQSSIIGRTEYVYENLDIRFPPGADVGSTYDLASKGISVRYARGGQGGEVDTRSFRGTISLIEISGSILKARCDLEFYGFTSKGSYGTVPQSVKRRGVLTAKAGYTLY